MTPVQTVLVTILTISVIFKLFKFLQEYWKIMKFFNTVPGPKTIFEQLAKEELLTRGYLKEFPRLHKIWKLPFLPFISVHHPETVKAVLKHRAFKKNVEFNTLHRITLIPDSLVASDNKGFVKDRRRILENFFTSERRFEYQLKTNDAVTAIMKKMEIMRGNDETLIQDVNKLMNRLVLDIHLRIFYSFDSKNSVFDTNQYINLEMVWMNLYVYRSAKWYLFPDIFYYLTSHGITDFIIVRQIRTLIKSLLDIKRNQQHRSGSPKSCDVMDILLNDNENSLYDTAIEMLLERRGTWAATTMALYYLAKYPSYQEVIRNEVSVLFNDNKMQSLQEEDFQKLKMTPMFIKEVFRLSSPFLFAERKITQELTLDGITFPKGTHFYLNLTGLHNNEESWDNPEEFRPERFSDDTKLIDLQQFKLLPFLAYERGCIAKKFALECEIIIIARILHQYQIAIKEDYIMTNVILNMTPDVAVPLCFTPIN